MIFLGIIAFLIALLIINQKQKDINNKVNIKKINTYCDNLIEIKYNETIKEKGLENPNFTYFEEDSNINCSNFICGNFYIIKNSEIIYSKKGVFEYELLGLQQKCAPKVLSNSNWIKKTQENIIQVFPENYLLFVSSFKEVPYTCELMPCGEYPYTHSWSESLRIYHNGVLVKEFNNKNYKWKVNEKQEILLYNGNDVVKLNLQGENETISTNSQYSYEVPYFEKKYIDEKYVYFYFFEKECELCYVLKEICKKADKFEIIQNKFNDDLETINYKATFSKDKIEEITLLFFILQKYLSFNTYNKISLNCKHCFGTSVYKIAIESYSGLLNNNIATNIIRNHIVSDSEKETYKNILEHIYEQYDLPVSYNSYPLEFFEDVATLENQYKNFARYIEKEKPELFYKNRALNLKKTAQSKLQKKYDTIKSELVYAGTIKRKWTSEVELFKLVKTYYPDAIYQYRAKWLNLQSLDIYIPSFKIGIEYQGIQHYEPVECFGGKNSFMDVQERDKIKKELCKKNGVKLIEWKYDEKIVKINLTKKIKNVTT